MASPQYDYQHQLERKAANGRLETLGPIPCRRCGQPVHCDAQRHLNRDGRKFELGHGVAHINNGDGSDKQPEHAYCNEAAGGRLARARQRATRATRDWGDTPSTGPRRVVVLVGPPGAGKTRAARTSGLHTYDDDDTTTLEQLANDPDARVVVIRSAPSSDERAALVDQIQATHIYLVDAPDHVIAARLKARGRGHMVAVARWRAAFDDDDDVPPFTGWEPVLRETRATREWP